MSADVRRPVDRWLVLFALALVAMGMVWIYSASAIKASQNHAAATAFLTRQLVGGGIGIAAGLGLALPALEVFTQLGREALGGLQRGESCLTGTKLRQHLPGGPAVPRNDVRGRLLRGGLRRD